ncbi:MAG: hypothetical protein KatS3mg001_032 [Candidatus Pacearchaeota archaeon]|nr:MAG: hypothetical protein KatS3mg001_032 [Candidatus Pacearchaeota archaeon]
MVNEIKIKKKSFILLLALIVTLPTLIILWIYLFQPGISVKNQASSDISGFNLEAKFKVLSEARTNFCVGPDVFDRVDTEKLQGSCCSAMDFHRYKEQIEGLANIKEKNSYIGRDLELIPDDPYDISRELADKLLQYQKTIQLSQEQQKIYEEAMKLSHEGGPCCCKCWRWYAFEGQAKKLIRDYGFTSEQIAELWDLEDGCGGSGHMHVEGIGEH